MIETVYINKGVLRKNREHFSTPKIVLEIEKQKDDIYSYHYAPRTYISL